MPFDFFNPTQFITALAVAAFMFFLGLLANWFRNRRTRIKDLEEENDAQRKRLRELSDTISVLKGRLKTACDAVAGDGLWHTFPPAPPSDYATQISNSIPIITIANLKGGVGKTTITANLAWFFERHGKRVLTIDLDFQGSLSALAANHENQRASVSSGLVDGSLTPTEELSEAWPMRDVPNARILTAYYGLARKENEAMVRWLLQEEHRDIRYFLSEFLQDPTIRRLPGRETGFDIVLIDAAPRLTTSTVQALSASTHLLIPTILDRLSVDAVGYFVRQYFINKQIWPNLKLAGIVGSMTQQNIGRLTDEPEAFDKLIDYERNALLRMDGALESIFDEQGVARPSHLIFPPYLFRSRHSRNRAGG